MTAKNPVPDITAESEAISSQALAGAVGDYACMDNLIWSRGIRFGAELSREEIASRYGVSE